VGGLLARHGTEERLAHDLLRACHRVGLEACIGIAASAGVARVAARAAHPIGPLQAEGSRAEIRDSLAGAVSRHRSSTSHPRVSSFDPRSPIDPQATIVPEGGEAAFLAPLPLALLEPSPEIAARLLCWGVIRIGELARLPRQEIAVRLADEGLALHRLACGEAERAFVPDRMRETLKEGALLEDSIGALDAFLFVLRGLLARLETRLELRGEGFAEVLLELALEGGGRREVRIKLVAPAREVAAVLALTRLQLEAAPPGAPVEGITALVTPGAVQLTQASLFGPRLPAPGKLAMTLARVAAVVGPDRVGAPAVPDTHRPGAWNVVPFTLPAPGREGARAAGGRRRGRSQTAGEGLDGSPGEGSKRARCGMGSLELREDERIAGRPAAHATQPVTSSLQPAAIDVRTPTHGARPRGSSPEAGWESGDHSPVLRAVRPPHEAEVKAANGRPVTVRVDGFGGAVVGYAGPYRFVGEWWGEEPFARDDFDVFTSDGALLRVYFDRVARRWYVDGVYD
jgi:hypothetical protein